MSVCLSHCTALRVCCCAGSHEISIDCCTTGMKRMNGTIRYQLRLRKDQQIASGWTKLEQY